MSCYQGIAIYLPRRETLRQSKRKKSNLATRRTIKFLRCERERARKVKTRQLVPIRKFHSHVADSDNKITNVKIEKCENKKRQSRFLTLFHKRYQANIKILNIILFLLILF